MFENFRSAPEIKWLHENLGFNFIFFPSFEVVPKGSEIRRERKAPLFSMFTVFSYAQSTEFGIAATLQLRLYQQLPQF